ncbi:BofC C-terminal domain-containing protein [Salsuginibacillus kocurii]|uniref:BofC C-terminal domain-containing protein n=1 Tax=Salsuginibacillus kocurii TaxID=427078 RepID=UPI00036B5AE5|nr:BofC C-terminal domain-containing protein [Salsuginibacillus kocurii]
MNTARLTILSILCVVAGIVIFLSITWPEDANEPEEDYVETYTPEDYGAKTVEVVTAQTYIDGVTEENVSNETIWSPDDFWAQYEDWTLDTQTDGEMLFTREINQLSPAARENGYLGIDEDGTLHLYQGMPEQGNILNTFFSLRLEELTTAERAELRAGLRVAHVEEFEQYINQFQQLKQ